MLIANTLINLTGFFVSLFIYWKKMKEDYASEIIFKSLTYIYLFLSLFFLIAFNFNKDLFLWLSFFGSIIGILLSYYSFKVRFFESLESFIVSVLPWLSLQFLSDSIATQSFISFSAFIYILFLMFGSYWLDANYKNFSWYKSGKIGISGIIILSVIFVTRLIVAFFEIPVISFVGNWEMWVSGLLLLISLSLVYSLSRYEK